MRSEALLLHPASARSAADAAVTTLAWKLLYFIDADHIGIQTVDRFLSVCDFYTIDVADFIGRPACQADIEAFLAHNRKLVGSILLKSIAKPLTITEDNLRRTATKFLSAAGTAGQVY
jgi:hypothetical protein